MTEAEWSETPDPQPMLEWLHRHTSDRKLRLLNCACCRRIWPLMRDARSRRMVEVAELFADGKASPAEVDEAVGAAFAASQGGTRIPDGFPNTPEVAAHFVMRIELSRFSYVSYALSTGEQCRLIRELWGNPFRPVTIEPAWLEWNQGRVKHIAATIYDRRLNDHPILADALEDAGCENREILTHCRSGQDHARGCWVIDSLLGRG